MLRIREQTAQGRWSPISIFTMNEHQLTLEFAACAVNEWPATTQTRSSTICSMRTNGSAARRAARLSRAWALDATTLAWRCGWLIFADRSGVGEQLAERLHAAGMASTLVFAGPTFAQRRDEHYEINPSSAEDMTHLLGEVHAPGRVPYRGIVHCGTSTRRPRKHSAWPSWKRRRKRACTAC